MFYNLRNWVQQKRLAFWCIWVLLLSLSTKFFVIFSTLRCTQVTSLCCAKVRLSARALHMHKTDFALLHQQSAVCLQSYRHGTGFAFLSWGAPERAFSALFFTTRGSGARTTKILLSLVWQRQKGTPVDKKMWLKQVQSILDKQCFYGTTNTSWFIK